MTFLEQLQETVEGREYLAIVEVYKKQNLKKEKGFEFHHICPKALGGSNEKENLIKVPTYEHCRLHALLALALPCTVTLKAVTRMSAGQVQNLSDLEKKNLEDFYEWSTLRNRGLHLPVSQETRKKMSESRKGIVLSEQTRQKLRDINLGKTIPEEVRQKIKESVQKTKRENRRVYVHLGSETKTVLERELDLYLTSGWKRGLSDEMKAARPKRTGHVVSQETRDKISMSLMGHKHSIESRKKMSETRKSKNNGRRAN